MIQPLRPQPLSPPFPRLSPRPGRRSPSNPSGMPTPAPYRHLGRLLPPSRPRRDLPDAQLVVLTPRSGREGRGRGRMMRMRRGGGRRMMRGGGGGRKKDEEEEEKDESEENEEIQKGRTRKKRKKLPPTFGSHPYPPHPYPPLSLIGLEGRLGTSRVLALPPSPSIPPSLPRLLHAIRGRPEEHTPAWPC